jgi:hypothetical protein
MQQAEGRYLPCDIRRSQGASDLRCWGGRAAPCPCKAGDTPPVRALVRGGVCRCGQVGVPGCTRLGAAAGRLSAQSMQQRWGRSGCVGCLTAGFWWLRGDNADRVHGWCVRRCICTARFLLLCGCAVQTAHTGGGVKRTGTGQRRTRSMEGW